jgi:hypothetical protein
LAKKCWEKSGEGLTDEERKVHTRTLDYGGAVNVHEEAMSLSLLTGSFLILSPITFLKEAEEFFARYGDGGMRLFA